MEGLCGNPRALGVQMVTNKQRSGITGDNWNNNRGRRLGVQRLYEGEVYVDPGTHRRKAAVEQRTKNLTPDGFRYARAPQQSSGLGANWGRIGPKIPYEPDTEGKRDGKEIRERAAAKEEAAKMGGRPWKTCNPPKKGYGASTPGLLFGPGPRKGEMPKMGKEYEHDPDPYDGPRDVIKAERRHQMEMLAGRVPYKTMSRSLDFFDGHRACAAPKGLTEDPIIPAREPPPKPEPISHLPFYPAKAPSSATSGHARPIFNKVSEYMEDPEEERLKARQEEAMQARAVGATPFKPSGTKSSKPVKTIIFHHPGKRPM